MRPTWVEVSRNALRHNFRTIQKLVGPEVAVCAVVKADAYGHGSVECARTLESEGAKWFGVTCTEEGLRLRQAGLKGRILLLAGFWRGDEAEVVRNQLTPAIWEWWQVGGLEAALNKLGRLSGPKFPVHLKLDTGMARLGVPEHYLKLFLDRLKAAPAIGVEGVFSHLASAEVVDAPDVEAQAAQFAKFEQQIRESGLKPRYWHISNSAAVVTHPQLWRDLVRPGLALYGYQLPPMNAAGKPAQVPSLGLIPALTWKSRIISLRDVPAGKPVGYGGTFVTRRPTKLAVLPVGYADGLNRHLSNRGQVIVRGALAPIAGRVTMDITVVDVTDIPGANVGDEAVLIGAGGNCRIGAWDHAAIVGTIPYEILCNISDRVPRTYVE